MEDGLRGNHLQVLREGGLCVLILVVMEDGLRVSKILEALDLYGMS